MSVIRFVNCNLLTATEHKYCTILLKMLRLFQVCSSRSVSFTHYLKIGQRWWKIENNIIACDNACDIFSFVNFNKHYCCPCCFPELMHCTHTQIIWIHPRSFPFSPRWLADNSTNTNIITLFVRIFAVGQKYLFIPKACVLRAFVYLGLLFHLYLGNKYSRTNFNQNVTDWVNV